MLSRSENEIVEAKTHQIEYEHIAVHNSHVIEKTLDLQICESTIIFMRNNSTGINSILVIDLWSLDKIFSFYQVLLFQMLSVGGTKEDISNKEDACDMNYIRSRFLNKDSFHRNPFNSADTALK